MSAPAVERCAWCNATHQPGTQLDRQHRSKLDARAAEIERQRAVRAAAPDVPRALWCSHRRARGGLADGYARGGWTHLHPCWRCGAGCTGYRSDDADPAVRTLACCLCGDRHTICAPDGPS